MGTIVFLASLSALLLIVERQFSLLRRRIGVRVKPTATRRQVRDRRGH